METHTNLEFSNGDLRNDYAKIQDYDEVKISKDYTINNDFIIDVNDNGYFYNNEKERDLDFNTLILLFPQNK